MRRTSDTDCGVPSRAVQIPSLLLPAHGSRLLAVSKTDGVQLFDANVRVNCVCAAEDALTLEVDYKYDDVQFTFHAAPKAIVCEGKEIAFTVENGVTKTAVPGKCSLQVLF